MAMFSGIEPEMAEEQETYSENDTEDRSYSESSRCRCLFYESRNILQYDR